MPNGTLLEHAVLNDVEIGFDHPDEDFLGEGLDVALLLTEAPNRNQFLNMGFHFPDLLFRHRGRVDAEDLPDLVNLKKNVVSLGGLLDEIFNRVELGLIDGDHRDDPSWASG